MRFFSLLPIIIPFVFAILSFVGILEMNQVGTGFLWLTVSVLLGVWTYNDYIDAKEEKENRNIRNIK